MHRPSHDVQGSEAAAVEVHPESTPEVEGIADVGVVAASFHQVQRLPGGDLVAGKTSPFRRDAGERGIDRGRTFEPRDAQSRIRLEAPDFIRRPRLNGLRNVQLPDDIQGAGNEGQGPAAGTGLNRERTVLIQLGGQFRIQPFTHESGQEGAGERDFPVLPRDIQFDRRFQRDGKTVPQQPVDDDVDPVLLPERHPVGSRATGYRLRVPVSARARRPAATNTKALSPGIAIDAGRLFQLNAPLTRCRPDPRRTDGRPPRETTAAAAPSTATSNGQFAGSPGSGTQLSAYSCHSWLKVAPEAVTSRDNSPGQAQT